MTKTLQAVYDGHVLRPDEPLELAPDTRVHITITTIEGADKPAQQSASFLQTALALKLDGPPDWSARLEDYLYDREDGNQ